MYNQKVLVIIYLSFFGSYIYLVGWWRSCH